VGRIIGLWDGQRRLRGAVAYLLRDTLQRTSGRHGAFRFLTVDAESAPAGLLGGSRGPAGAFGMQGLQGHKGVTGDAGQYGAPGLDIYGTRGPTGPAGKPVRVGSGIPGRSIGRGTLACPAEKARSALRGEQTSAAFRGTLESKVRRARTGQMASTELMAPPEEKAWPELPEETRACRGRRAKPGRAGAAVEETRACRGRRAITERRDLPPRRERRGRQARLEYPG
jgi:hypothetical protein